ncbi:MAG: hypothetical protein ABSA79_10520 [Candidatus Bathyarchaeia archaeon]|jgi:metal-responsive CopG/Arc/MetJ family transcriptional regulator
MVKNMKRFMMSVSDEMYVELEKERKSRRLETVQEVTRQIVADYLRENSPPEPGSLEEKWLKEGDKEERRIIKEQTGMDIGATKRVNKKKVTSAEGTT